MLSGRTPDEIIHFHKIKPIYTHKGKERKLIDCMQRFIYGHSMSDINFFIRIMQPFYPVYFFYPVLCCCRGTITDKDRGKMLSLLLSALPKTL